jgi:hypothetical protein
MSDNKLKDNESLPFNLSYDNIINDLNSIPINETDILFEIFGNDESGDVMYNDLAKIVKLKMNLEKQSEEAEATKNENIFSKELVNVENKLKSLQSFVDISKKILSNKKNLN